MKQINVLILSAGRRVELIKCFKHARDILGIEGRIVAADCSDIAPALYFADEMAIVPRISAGEGYVSSIIDICNEKSIDLIVPTIDTELLLLAQNRDFIEKNTKAKLLVSDYSVISICRDKVNTQKFFEENGFLVPHLYSEEELNSGKYELPLFIKPLDGSSSINTFKVNSKEELDIFRKIVDKPMVQDFMDGEEYTIDCFVDFDGKVISIVPRIRLATRSGEIAKGRIVRDKDIIADVMKVMEALKPIGHITVQCRKTKRGIEYIEINPRFGGGAPMSIASGADSCEYLYRILMGETLEYRDDWKENLTFLRFDASIMLDENLERSDDYFLS